MKGLVLVLVAVARMLCGVCLCFIILFLSVVHLHDLKSAICCVQSNVTMTLVMDLILSDLKQMF